jgi:AraC family transcriptional regulator
MMVRLLPVPALKGDLLHVGTAGDFVVSESLHRTAIPMHAHACATLTIPVEGVFEERYYNRVRPETCGSASVLFRPPAERHADLFGRDGTRNLVIEIEDSRLRLLRDRRSLPDEVRQWQSTAVLGITRRMRAELSTADAMTPLALEALSLELLAELGRAAFRERARCCPAWLVRARELLGAAVQGPTPKVAAVAQAVGVHPVHLARAFRRHYQVTPGEFLRRLRLEAAKAELSGPESLAAIAHRAGFTDQSHFTRAFKAAFGTTPGSWRARRDVLVRPTSLQPR